ncbi:SDR family oxidoreductase [Chondrinema litorale]|uniref:SDR family oxidoreductase n=1 Tax=Chondrinema litorale TaxID=2994555 RepID=UPI0025433699|nr:aldehyde reductase [Chondrinema litorale]UZR97933.1 aldehyde reductase [Chondrinema litorale]
MMQKQDIVLLTGVTGFLGSHTTIQLLEKGYKVIGTLRKMQRASDMLSVIGTHTANFKNLSFVEADLTDENIWFEITKGVDYIQHVASPFPRVLPKKEEDLILPSKNGTLNILKAAAANGVKRVVLTSSSGAMIYGKSKQQRNSTFDESDWTNIANKKDSTPYFRSKTIAEKAAWDFIEKDTSGLELATVCPGAILGPVLEKDFGTSANIVIKTMDGSSPAIPDIGFDVVDVRSVADLLIRAMELPQAANKRYVGSAGYLKFKEVASIVKQAYPNRKVPSMVIPDFMVKLFANIDKSLKPILIDLSVERKVDNSRAKQELGWNPISNREAVLSCAESVIKQGIVK